MEEVMNGILIREVETKNIMTKSSLPVGGYSVNPYVGCTHACKYCYASFMKRYARFLVRVAAVPAASQAAADGFRRGTLLPAGPLLP